MLSQIQLATKGHSLTHSYNDGSVSHAPSISGAARDRFLALTLGQVELGVEPQTRL